MEWELRKGGNIPWGSYWCAQKPFEGSGPAPCTQTCIYFCSKMYTYSHWAWEIKTVISIKSVCLGFDTKLVIKKKKTWGFQSYEKEFVDFRVMKKNLWAWIWFASQVSTVPRLKFLLLLFTTSRVPKESKNLTYKNITWYQMFSFLFSFCPEKLHQLSFFLQNTMIKITM